VSAEHGRVVTTTDMFTSHDADDGQRDIVVGNGRQPGR
jgi:hypothetical protein